MTWAPCPHGVRTRGEKRHMVGKHGRRHPMQQRSLAVEPKCLAADYGHDESFLMNYDDQQLLPLVHKGNNCTGSHSDLIRMLCGQEGITSPKTRDVSHIGIMSLDRWQKRFLPHKHLAICVDLVV